MTPVESPTPIVTFVVKNPRDHYQAQEGKCHGHSEEHQLRISPPVFNDQQDIDKLLNALA